MLVGLADFFEGDAIRQAGQFLKIGNDTVMAGKGWLPTG